MRSTWIAIIAVLLLAPLRAFSQTPTPTLDPQIQKLIDTVSEPRLQALLNKLQSFDTRATMSDQTSPTRGIGAAREWIRQEMQRSSARLQVSFDAYVLPPQGDRIPREVDLRNIVAVLPGKSARRIYISGHYDSLARDPKSQQPGFEWAHADNFAPGANDDGSGTALTMELARVFGESGIDFDATLVFVAFAGEEQGLIGAKAHAQQAAKDKLRIDAVLNNDMVGNSHGGAGEVDSSSVRVFSEGPEDSPSRQIARYIARWAPRYYPSHRIDLIARHDRFGRGGDHTAFNQNGFPGVRITETKENYSHQHSVLDTVEGVDFDYLARNVRVNATVVAALALAPAAPVVVNERGAPTLLRTPSGYDAHLRWQAARGAVAYRLFWRDAWEVDWTHDLLVGNVTEAILPNVSIDDYVFGVAAVDGGGHESLVAAYVNPDRPEQPVVTK